MLPELRLGFLCDDDHDYDYDDYDYDDYDYDDYDVHDDVYDDDPERSSGENLRFSL